VRCGSARTTSRKALLVAARTAKHEAVRRDAWPPASGQQELRPQVATPARVQQTTAFVAFVQMALFGFGSVATGQTSHSLLPLVCRFQRHSARPKSVLGKQDIKDQRSKFFPSPRPVGHLSGS
jgi:hypothetical protein